MKSQIRYLGLCLLLAFFGCHQATDMNSMEMADKAMIAPAHQEKVSEPIERKLIKEGWVEFETDNLNNSREQIIASTTKYNAYISSDQAYKSPGRESNTIIIRVPAEHFDALLADATIGVDKFDRKEINVKDVTEEFLDIEARLKTKKELELRYLELLKKASTVTEMLEIERQSGELRSEIESIEGRLKYLQNQVSFSTLTLSFYQRIPHQTEFDFKFRNGFRNGWENLIWFFVALINIWPFVLIVIGLFVGIRHYRNKN